jgi:hypothetical protein
VGESSTTITRAIQSLSLFNSLDSMLASDLLE